MPVRLRDIDYFIMSMRERENETPRTASYSNKYCKSTEQAPDPTLDMILNVPSICISLCMWGYDVYNPLKCSLFSQSFYIIIIFI